MVSYDTPVSVVQALVVKMDIEVMTYEDMTPHCSRSVVQSCLSELIYEW